MVELCRLIWCALIGLFRSQASLEAEILVLRHQINILRRKSPKRPTFSNIDRLIFAGLYGVAPNVLSALAIVKPEIRNPLAPEGFSPVLAMEVKIAWWPSEAVGRHQAIDPRHQPCQPALGCTKDTRRAAQAWHRCRADDGRQVYGEEKETAVARMEDVSAQSCRRHCLDGLVCGPDHLVSTAVWAADFEARPPRNVVSYSNQTSQRRMDKSPIDGGLRLGGGAMLSRARSGQRIRRGLPPASSGDGYSGSADRATVAMAKWLL